MIKSAEGSAGLSIRSRSPRSVERRSTKRVYLVGDDTCVLGLTRVRAQLQASMSVSRVCFVARFAAPPTTDLF